MTMKECKQCKTDISSMDKRAIFCSKSCSNQYASIKRTEKIRLESIEFYKDKPITSYVECKICGHCAPDLSNHILKIHNMTVTEYKNKYNVKLVKSEDECDKVRGANNPGFQHGGKLSPFSTKFVKYQNLSEDDKITEANKIIDKAHDVLNSDSTKRPTNLDYYISRGLTLEEAKIALSNRQSTFSLKKCVAQHGLEKGFELWKDRQGLWQRTLNSKSDEEKKLINSKKVANFNYKHLMSLKETDGVNGLLYVIRLTNGHVKIGISTKNSVAERYSNNNYYISETIKEINDNLYVLYILERYLVDRFQDYMIDKDEMINHVFGYTETFKGLDSNRIINTIDKYFDSLKEI